MTSTHTPTHTPTDTPVRTGALVSGLNHAAIVTTDLERLVAFYVDVFDLDTVEVPAPPGTRSTIVRLTETTGLAIMEMTGNPHGSGSVEMLRRGHLDHIAIEASSPAALAVLRDRLVARGASDGTINDYGALLSVYFVDPDGMGCEACWIRDPLFTDAHAPQPYAGTMADLAAERRM
jgi:catechol 2,3-dioxygenase-like lactoylglutathione lyase family enzyme